MPKCPKGHLSADDDYCDECGVSMSGQRSAPQPPADAGSCPECLTPRESGARFCEVCQHDFQISAPGAKAAERSDSLAREALSLVKPPAKPMASTPPTQASAAPTPAASLALPLLARIQADPALCPDEESKASFPAEGIPERIFHLDLDENLVGRDSASMNSNPEIPLDDVGASRRHLKFIRVDGSFRALELGSSNGTLLNGQPLSPGVPAPIAPGSELRLGIWTRILIEAR